MAALAVVGLAACTNEESGNPVSGENTQSVVLSLAGLGNTSTKAIEGSETENTTITLDDVTICFADASTIYRTEKFDSKSAEWADLTDKDKGIIFHEVPAAVTTVYALSNATGVDVSTVAKLKASTVKMKDQQDFDNVLLYGSSTLTTVEDGEHQVGTGADAETHPTLKKADITIAPLVSRIEIGNIQCTGNWTEFKSIELKHIGLADFHSQTTIEGTLGGTFVQHGENLLAPGSSPVEGKIVFGSTDNADIAWAWDAITGGTLANNNTKFNPEGTKKFAYEFLPKDAIRIKLYVQATRISDGQIDPFNTVVTAGFSSLQPGYIYTVDLAFEENDIKPWDPKDLTCIQVSVTAKPWTVQALTPVYE